MSPTPSNSAHVELMQQRLAVRLVDETPLGAVRISQASGLPQWFVMVTEERFVVLEIAPASPRLPLRIMSNAARLGYALGLYVVGWHREREQLKRELAGAVMYAQTGMVVAAMGRLETRGCETEAGIVRQHLPL